MKTNRRGHLKRARRSAANPSNSPSGGGADRRHDPGGDDLAPLGVGHPGHGHLGHAGVLEENVLHLPGVHVEAAGDDQLPGPAHEAEVAVGVVLADVAAC